MVRGMGALLILTGLALAGCSDLGEPLGISAPDPGDGEPGLSFAREVQPILQACVGCHNPEMSIHANLVNMEAVGYGGALRVAPGDTTASVAYQKIIGNPDYGPRMPLGPPGSELLPAQIALIGQWIEEGAPDN